MSPVKQPRQRKQPQRTCIGCRLVRPKRELLRIVRTPAGEVLLDPTGKAARRGAYVDKRKSCLLAALEHNRLEHALEISLTAEQRAFLVSAAEALSDE
ncbi:MAG: RNase P modulator RnpM [Anaerolineae bacterium]